MSGITTGRGEGRVWWSRETLDFGTAIPSSATSSEPKLNGRPTRAGRIPEQLDGGFGPSESIGSQDGPELEGGLRLGSARRRRLAGGQATNSREEGLSEDGSCTHRITTPRSSARSRLGGRCHGISCRSRRNSKLSPGWFVHAGDGDEGGEVGEGKWRFQKAPAGDVQPEIRTKPIARKAWAFGGALR